MKEICLHCKKEFIISSDEIIQYKKNGIELPTLCFFCRVKLHLSFWLFGKFRKGVSDLSGKDLITILPKNTRYPIYTLKEWHSDIWDGFDYGQEYDYTILFFQQLKNLQEKVPRPHQNGTNNIKCKWSDDVWNSKNCYLSRSMEECEDLLYSYRNVKVKNSIDMTVCFNSERCYDSLNCNHSYKLFYSRDSRDCVDSYFLFDCRNCQDCFMCWNLRNKSYCIENIQYSKDEYIKKIKSYNLNSYTSIKSFKLYYENLLKKEVIHRQNFNIQANNSDGNFLINTKNCHNSFTSSDSEDNFNVVRGIKDKSCIDISGCWYSEFCGNCSSCVKGYNLKYSLWSSSRNSEYLDLCIECDNCFGCIGLKKKNYCILNKQYTKEEYFKLKEKIITDMKKRGEYGSFFPYSMSLGPFNFSTSFTYFPNIKKSEILKLGGYWEDINKDNIEGLSTNELPDSIKDVSVDICSQALICPKTGWRFNISKDELLFYQKNNIPLPRFHFDFRNLNRLKYLTVLQKYPYTCYFCNKKIYAYYLPEWNYQRISCNECYKLNLN